MSRESANEALLKAIEEGDVNKMELAISQGADVNATTTREPHNPFILIAARFTNPQLCQKLIEKGARVNAKNDNGTTALMEASSAEIAQTLIRAGAFVNSANDMGKTALMLVPSSNNFSENDVVKQFNVLLNAGANPFAKDKEGNDVLFYINHEEKCGWITHEDAKKLKDALAKAKKEQTKQSLIQQTTTLPKPKIVPQRGNNRTN